MVSPSDSRRVLDAVASSPLRGASLRKLAMEKLSRLPNYDWSGVYRLENGELVLDEYVGAPTDHTRIPVGVGVCGTAVAEDRNVLVDDVRKLDNYLACSLATRSEIVVLIKEPTGHLLGQIDIDSHREAAFDGSDEAMLKELGIRLAERWD